MNTRWSIFGSVFAKTVLIFSAVGAEVPPAKPENWHEISDWTAFEDDEICWVEAAVTTQQDQVLETRRIGTIFVSYFAGDPVPEVSLTLLDPQMNIERATLVLFDFEIELETEKGDAWLRPSDISEILSALRGGDEIEIVIEDAEAEEIEASVSTRGFQMALNAISQTCWFAKGLSSADGEDRG